MEEGLWAAWRHCQIFTPQSQQALVQLTIKFDNQMYQMDRVWNIARTNNLLQEADCQWFLLFKT